jgi:hypothetical protein
MTMMIGKKKKSFQHQRHWYQLKEAFSLLKDYKQSQFEFFRSFILTSSKHTKFNSSD